MPANGDSEQEAGERQKRRKVSDEIKRSKLIGNAILDISIFGI